MLIADELTEDDLVLRYRVEETDDGFSGEEGTFTICSFWLVEQGEDRLIVQEAIVFQPRAAERPFPVEARFLCHPA